jgi:hypothetical protein
MGLLRALWSSLRCPPADCSPVEKKKRKEANGMYWHNRKQDKKREKLGHLSSQQNRLSCVIILPTTFIREEQLSVCRLHREFIAEIL